MKMLRVAYVALKLFVVLPALLCLIVYLVGGAILASWGSPELQWPLVACCALAWLTQMWIERHYVLAQLHGAWTGAMFRWFL